ncbi:MAG TPA: S-methyl-5'-thioadenosine phosphorylase [Candidatus Krumholzibacteriaceae bacterium]|nr:S-methyl-5'-thioadenosine phosphorylase [Candidatus Krumholzibacteriaceae bacterium]
MSMQAEIGLIGGTGVYDPQLLKNAKEIKVHTPYGSPSDLITVGELKGRKIAFVPRHGKKHTIRPSDINNRANIYALKELGVQWILAPSAVGSLKEEFKPGDLVFVDQFIDRTTRREQSFYTGSQVCHITVAEPTCPELRKILTNVASNLKIRHHTTGTYVCIEGPRFSTKAESKLFRSWGADVIGMTLVPECVLAREAQMCYASIATVTDYDVWKEHPVNTKEIMRTMKESIEKVKQLITEAIPKIPKTRKCECAVALKNALI